MTHEPDRLTRLALAWAGGIVTTLAVVCFLLPLASLFPSDDAEFISSRFVWDLAMPIAAFVGGVALGRMAPYVHALVGAVLSPGFWFPAAMLTFDVLRDRHYPGFVVHTLDILFLSTLGFVGGRRWARRSKLRRRHWGARR